MNPMRMRLLKLSWLSSLPWLVTGCATTPSYDYTAYRASRPASILVLPPTNASTDITASDSVLAQATLPLAESGYYVIPVAVADETFRQNGLTNADEIASVPPAKLREIFGADAALYINVKEFGSYYIVVGGDTVASADARLIDLRSGALLWEGKAKASATERRAAAGAGGVIGILISAIVFQIIDDSTNAAHAEAGYMNQRLLSAGQPAGLLYGPRSPKYQQD